MELKDNLRKFRKAANLTLNEASDAIGVTVATLQRYESGVIANVPYANIVKLAKLYHTTPTELMGWNEDALEIVKSTLQFPDDKEEWAAQFNRRIMRYYDALGAAAVETILDKYLSLDDRGRHTVTTVLEMEYQRCQEEQKQE